MHPWPFQQPICFAAVEWILVMNVCMPIILWRFRVLTSCLLLPIDRKRHVIPVAAILLCGRRKCSCWWSLLTPQWPNSCGSYSWLRLWNSYEQGKAQRERSEREEQSFNREREREREREQIVNQQRDREEEITDCKLMRERGKWGWSWRCSGIGQQKRKKCSVSEARN